MLVERASPLPRGEGQGEGRSPLLVETGLAASAIGTMSVGVNLEALFGLIFLGRRSKLLHFQSGLRLLQDGERVAAIVNEAVDHHGVLRGDRLQEGGRASQIHGDRSGLFQGRCRAGHGCIDLVG